MIEIRAATPDDFDALLALAQLMHAESKNPFPPVEPERLRQSLELSIAHPETFMVALAWTPKACAVGIVTACAGDYAWSTERRAIADLLFADPAHRSFLLANRALDAFETWAARSRARRTLIGNMTGLDAAAFARLLERRGYGLQGHVYAKELG